MKTYRLDVDTVLLKIFFPDDGRGKSGEGPIPDIPHAESQTVQSAKKRFERRINAERKGKDTGVNFIQNFSGVGGKYFLPTLLLDGWVPCGETSHWFQKGHQQVLVVPVKKPSSIITPVSQEVIKAIADIMSGSFICHGWLNPSPQPTTVNLVKPKIGKATHAVAIRNGRIGLISYKEMMA